MKRVNKEEIRKMENNKSLPSYNQGDNKHGDKRQVTHNRKKAINRPGK